MSTWEDLDSSNSDTDEESNIGLMTDEADNSMSEDSDNEICSTQVRQNLSWYLDSECSRNMMGKRSIFQDLQMKKGGKVISGGNQHGRVIGGGMVSLKPTMSINNVLFVDGLKHNLLSISQLCDSGNSVVFNRDQCIVNNSNGTRLFVANICGNLYKIDMSELSDQKVSCLMTLKEDHWLGIGSVAILAQSYSQSYKNIAS